MKKAPYGEPADFIVPLNINGLDGRMLRIPSKKKKAGEILFIYGSHSSLERWWGIAVELSKVANVTMPDLPGLGGMTPLYKIGKAPTVDNMADYLATFIKLKYRNKKVTIAGMSFGFVVVTRMLQKYPELSKKVNLLISIVGFAHKSDLSFSKKRLTFYRSLSRIFAYKYPSLIFRYTALQPFVLRQAYHRTNNAKEKFQQMNDEEFNKTMETEIDLWRINDLRTQFSNYLEIFALDNTKTRINLPVHHVAAKKDRYFNNVLVEEHFRRVFSDFIVHYTKAPNHAPTVIADPKDAAPFVPPELRKLISKQT